MSLPNGYNGPTPHRAAAIGMPGTLLGVKMELEKYFKGLANNTRLRIVNLLLHGRLCGCDLQHVLGISQSNISRHLTYLKNSGLVLDRRVGFRIYYCLAPLAHGSGKLVFQYLRNAFLAQPSLEQEKLKAGIQSGACAASEWRPYSALTRPKSDGAARV